MTAPPIHDETVIGVKVQNAGAGHCRRNQAAAAGRPRLVGDHVRLGQGPPGGPERG
jgi:hypothetical protein